MNTRQGTEPTPFSNGLVLFFTVLKREFWGLFGLNLLFLVTSIPLVTIGPSTAALFHVLRRMVQDEPVYVLEDYKEGFKENWKQGLVAQLLLLLVGGWVYFSFSLGVAEQSLLLLGVAVFLGLLLATTLVFVFPLMVSVYLPLATIFRNALLLGLSKLFYALPIGLIILATGASLILLFPYSIPAYYLGVFSILALLSLCASWNTIQAHALKHE